MLKNEFEPNAKSGINSLPRINEIDVSYTINATPFEYSYDKTTQIFSMNLNRPLPDNILFSLRSVKFFPMPTTVTDNTTFSFTITYNSTTTPFTIPQGSYSINDIYNYILQAQIQAGLYVLDANHNFYVFIKTALGTSNGLTVLTTSPTVLPAGGSNPNSMVLNGFAPQIRFSTNLAAFLGGYTAGTNFPTSASSAVSSTFLSTGLPLHQQYDFKITLPGSSIDGRFACPQSSFLFSDSVPISSQKVTIQPKWRSWYAIGNTQGLQVLQWKFTAFNNLGTQLINTNHNISFDVIEKP